MATSFLRSMNTHVTVFSPVLKVKKKHNTEKIMLHMLLHKSPSIKNCVRRPLFSLWTYMMTCSIFLEWVADRAWVIGHCDVGDGSGAAPQPRCAKLVPFSFHSSWRIQLGNHIYQELSAAKWQIGIIGCRSNGLSLRPVTGMGRQWLSK